MSALRRRFDHLIEKPPKIDDAGRGDEGMGRREEF